MAISWLTAAQQFLRLETGEVPLTPGRTVYLLKMKFGDGLRAAWYRDVVRPQILAAVPLELPEDKSCEIHALTSGDDWLNLVWALRSFAFFSGRQYALCIHDDGTLTDDAVGQLEVAFPHARLISRREADDRLRPVLSDLPRCSALRATNKLAPKVFDFAFFLEADRLILLDSDILFFAPPTALLNALRDPAFCKNTLNKDWGAGYTIDLEKTRALLDFDLPPMINSGLGLLHRASLRFDWVEEFLGLPDILSHSHQIEQTLIALCSARFGFEMLPTEYDVHLGPHRPGAPIRHYTGPIRHLMFSEGIRSLARQGFLKSAN
ncbi:MAG TPA: hypothetical protein VFD27_13090 [Chthoniobacteraceae bacterium]|nr:hypothetical protein [Chthoniobacteraceae bacterium]